MQSLRCLIADDEPLAVRLLQSYVERHPRLVAAGAYTDPGKALATLEHDAVDLAFLDIEMPGMSGMELARAIASRPTRVVFVTAYRDYAVEGFRVQALDYLLKPVSYEEFCLAADRALAAIKPVEHISVTSGYRRLRIALSDIIFIQGLKDYVKIVCTDRPRPVLTQISLKEMAALLPGSRFRRVHRSYIVNTDMIDYITGGSISLCSHIVPIGNTYRGSVADLVR